MRRVVAALTLLVAACSPAEPDSSSTTVTTEPTATTTTLSSSTTSTPTTTITTPSTTTLAPTTTTLLEGNWADQPLVTTDFAALGWWNGSDWLDAETEGALPVSGGEDYQVIVADQVGRTTGGPQIEVCEPLFLIGVELEDPELLGTFPGPIGLAVSAPWPLQPHFYEELAGDTTYAGVASDLLSERGLEVASPVIKQVVRTDLEGDGVNEVFVVAEDVTQGFILEPGDYSILFMQKVIDGSVATAVIEETVVLSEDEQFGGIHMMGTVADLNGDGKMEIVTNSSFFEGFGITVWEYIDDDQGIALRLQAGCGS